MAKRNNTSFDKMKNEIAQELGIDLQNTSNLLARDAGKVGGNIVKKVFSSYTGNNYPTSNR